MRKNIFKIALIAMLCLLLLAMPLSAAAEVERVEWLSSEDGSTLYASTDKVYTAYELPAGVYMDPKTIYEYADTVDLPNQDLCYVYGTEPNGEIVWVETFNGARLYATDAGKTMLDGLLNGSTDNVYRLYAEPQRYFGYLDAAMLIALNESEDKVPYDVTDLADWNRYEITAHDAAEVLARNHGLLLEDANGALFYVNFDALDNTHFDADGNFSFRSGEVLLTPLTEAMSAEAQAALAERQSTLPVIEQEDPTADDMPIFLFWIVYIPIGMLLPLPFIAVGIILPQIKPLGKPKYWYLAAILGAVWLLLAVLLMILLLV